MEKYYKVAGLTLKMDASGITAERAERYRCPPCETPDMVIQTRWQRLYEKHPTLTAEEAEYLATGLCFYRNLLQFDGMMLHASAVVLDGRAYLFSADSGVGKSTHTALWLKIFGERACILNDDKPALRLEGGRWVAYGTPWSGKHDLNADLRVPLGGIALLERGEKNEIVPATGREAVQKLIKQVNRPRDAVYRMKLLELMDRLISGVPIWKLTCNQEPEAARVAYEAMARRGENE